MVERFNRRIRDDVLNKHRFYDIIDMNTKLVDYVNYYNFQVRLKALCYKSPAEYLKENKNIFTQRIVI